MGSASHAFYRKIVSRSTGVENPAPGPHLVPLAPPHRHWCHLPRMTPPGVPPASPWPPCHAGSIRQAGQADLDSPRAAKTVRAPQAAISHPRGHPRRTRAERSPATRTCDAAPETKLELPEGNAARAELVSSEWVRPGMWYACMCGTTGTRAYQVLIARRSRVSRPSARPLPGWTGYEGLDGERRGPFLSSGSRLFRHPHRAPRRTARRPEPLQPSTLFSQSSSTRRISRFTARGCSSSPVANARLRPSTRAGRERGLPALSGARRRAPPTSDHRRGPQHLLGRGTAAGTREFVIVSAPSDIPLTGVRISCPKPQGRPHGAHPPPSGWRRTKNLPRRASAGHGARLTSIPRAIQPRSDAVCSDSRRSKGATSEGRP